MGWPKKRTPSSVLAPFIKENRNPSTDNDQYRNMGRVQQAESHWRDHGSDHKGSPPYHRGPEAADVEERHAHGRPLTAGYRHLIGPTPKLEAGDRMGARRFLRKIQAAIDSPTEHGGWTRSEWTRLLRMKNKWAARAMGTDARFNEVGNRQGGLTKTETVNVQQRRIVADMQRELEDASHTSGD